MRLGPFAAVFAASLAAGALLSGQTVPNWGGVLDEHPAIQYATRPTTDRIAKLAAAVADGTATLTRDAKTGYLAPVLRALGIPVETQLLIFSKTGVQGAFTSPSNPRALYFDRSVVVGYIPGAPFLELAADDPQQGVVFYTMDQGAPAPRMKRLTSCLSCHVSASTMGVPGLIARSHTVDDGGHVLPQSDTHDVDHRTPHPDRWGGWFVTTEAVVPYSQRAHAGNISFSDGGVTSSQIFVDWMVASPPDARGYLSPTSDIVAALLFDHQAHAINLLTRLNWEARIGSDTTALVRELAEYLLFTGEAPPSVPLTPLAGFAESFAKPYPKDRRGRSFAQLDLDRRLLRYGCSYMVYSEAFDALPAAVRQAVYHRMIDVLSAKASADRSAVIEILRDTKRDFPRADATHDR